MLHGCQHQPEYLKTNILSKSSFHMPYVETIAEVRLCKLQDIKKRVTVSRQTTIYPRSSTKQKNCLDSLAFIFSHPLINRERHKTRVMEEITDMGYQNLFYRLGSFSYFLLFSHFILQHSLDFGVSKIKRFISFLARLGIIISV